MNDGMDFRPWNPANEGSPAYRALRRQGETIRQTRRDNARRRSLSARVSARRTERRASNARTRTNSFRVVPYPDDNGPRFNGDNDAFQAARPRRGGARGAFNPSYSRGEFVPAPVGWSPFPEPWRGRRLASDAPNRFAGRGVVARADRFQRVPAGPVVDDYNWAFAPFILPAAIPGADYSRVVPGVVKLADPRIARLSAATGLSASAALSLLSLGLTLEALAEFASFYAPLAPWYGSGGGGLYGSYAMAYDVFDNVSGIRYADNGAAGFKLHGLYPDQAAWEANFEPALHSWDSSHKYGFRPNYQPDPTPTLPDRVAIEATGYQATEPKRKAAIFGSQSGPANQPLRLSLPPLSVRSKSQPSLVERLPPEWSNSPRRRNFREAKARGSASFARRVAFRIGLFFEVHEQAGNAQEIWDAFLRGDYGAIVAVLGEELAESVVLRYLRRRGGMDVWEWQRRNTGHGLFS